MKSTHFFSASIFFSVLVFVLISTTRISAQVISTVGEIYDYEINDEFHIRESGQAQWTGFAGYKNILITGKFYSADADTLFYERSVNAYWAGTDNPNGSYDFYTDTVFYTDLNAPIQDGYIDTVYTAEAYNGRKINANTSAEPTYSEFERKFIEGCGGPYQSHFYYTDESSVQYDYALIYFQKGMEEWGMRHDITSVETLTSTFDLKIYPNPASDKLRIDLHDAGNNTWTGVIFSNTGQPIRKFNLSSVERTEFDISTLSQGLYTIQLTADDAVYSGKFVKY